jgi:DNA invertase Pin-like site-specific DNA recombinase
MSGQRIGYVRVSSADQSTVRQLSEVHVDRTFTDTASGKSTDRPALTSALSYLRDGDTLVVHSMDRLARNAEDLLRLVRELVDRGVSVEFVTNRLTFSSRAEPMAKLMLTMLAAFGEFERALIRERQREGIAIAKKKGIYKGRRKALSAEQARELRESVARGDKSKSSIARTYGISRETLYQYLRAT